jgi:hypothetical protein
MSNIWKPFRETKEVVKNTAADAAVVNNIPVGEDAGPPQPLTAAAAAAMTDAEELVLTARGLPRQDAGGGGGEPLGRQHSKMSSYSPPHQNMLPRNHVIGSRARWGRGGDYNTAAKAKKDEWQACPPPPSKAA